MIKFKSLASLTILLLISSAFAVVVEEAPEVIIFDSESSSSDSGDEVDDAAPSNFRFNRPPGALKTIKRFQEEMRRRNSHKKPKKGKWTSGDDSRKSNKEPLRFGGKGTWWNSRTIFGDKKDKKKNSFGPKKGTKGPKKGKWKGIIRNDGKKSFDPFDSTKRLIGGGGSWWKSRTIFGNRVADATSSSSSDDDDNANALVPVILKLGLKKHGKKPWTLPPSWKKALGIADSDSDSDSSDDVQDMQENQQLFDIMAMLDNQQEQY